MIWDDFVKLFMEHHIPKSVMKLKRHKFLSLQQRNLSDESLDRSLVVDALKHLLF
jgi:hypothetical protein